LQNCMTFQCCSIKDLSKECLSTVNVVVGLHTCGGLTDAALEILHKLARKEATPRREVAKHVHFLICPCCFRNNRDLIPSFPLGWTSSRAQEVPDRSPTMETAQAIAENDRFYRFSEEEIDCLTRLAESSHRVLSLNAMICINVQRMLRFDQAISCSNGGSLDWIHMNSFDKDISLKNLVIEGHLTVA